MALVYYFSIRKLMQDLQLSLRSGPWPGLARQLCPEVAQMIHAGEVAVLVVAEHKLLAVREARLVLANLLDIVEAVHVDNRRRVARRLSIVPVARTVHMAQ